MLLTPSSAFPLAPSHPGCRVCRHRCSGRRLREVGRGTETCPSLEGAPKSPEATGAWAGSPGGGVLESRCDQRPSPPGSARRWGEETLPDGRTLKYWVRLCARASGGRCLLPPALLPRAPSPVPFLTASPHLQTAANSWGPAWGERGHFRIVRGANECDIESFVLGVWGRVGMEDMGHH